jgi:hypothetical protein
MKAITHLPLDPGLETSGLYLTNFMTFFFYHGATAPPVGQGPPHYRGFTITVRHTTAGRTLLDEWSDRRIDLYLTTHNNHNRQISMPSAGFEPTIPENEEAADPRLRPCGNRYRFMTYHLGKIITSLPTTVSYYACSYVTRRLLLP